MVIVPGREVVHRHGTLANGAEAEPGTALSAFWHRTREEVSVLGVLVDGEVRRLKLEASEGQPSEPTMENDPKQ